MRTKRRRVALAVLAAAAVVQATFVPRLAQATEGEAAYQYTMTTLGESCGGKCTKGLCCKIVMVPGLAEHVPG